MYIIVIMNNAIILASVGGATLVIIVVLLSSVFDMAGVVGSMRTGPLRVPSNCFRLCSSGDLCVILHIWHCHRRYLTVARKGTYIADRTAILCKVHVHARNRE